MGFKSVELQVAIPRSQDAGKMQDQLSRQGQQFQDTLSQQKLHEDVLRRQRVNKQEKVVKQGDKEQGSSSSQERQDIRKKNNDTSEETTDYEHPYLGKQVDFTR